MNRKALAIVSIVVLLLGIVVMAAINKNISSGERESTSVVQEKTTVPPERRMEYSDRLCGTYETNYEAKEDTVTVTYGDMGYIKRIFASDELLKSQQNYSQQKTQLIDGMEVTLSGKNGRIYTAAWVDNYNSYIVELNPDGNGVDEKEMATYVSATR